MTIHQMCEAAAQETCAVCGHAKGEACEPGNHYHLARVALATKHQAIPVADFAELLAGNEAFSGASIIVDAGLTAA